MAEKINQIQINGTMYDLQDKDAKAPFTGTTAQVEEAIASGDIKEGDIVNITDDVSEKFDTLNSYEEIMANTEKDKITGAIGVKEGFEEILGNLGGLRFGYDGDGNPGCYGADDSFIPFSSGVGGEAELITYFCIMVSDNVVNTSYSTDTSYSITEAGKYTLISMRGPIYDPGYTIKHNSDELKTYNAIGFSKKEGIISDKIEITCEIGDTISIENIVNPSDATKNNVVRVLLFKNSEASAKGEIENVPLVPTLTSNTGSDGGEAFTTGNPAIGSAYIPFSGNTDVNTHVCGVGYTKLLQVGYKFASPVCIKQVSIRSGYCGYGYGIKDFNIEASNNGSDWDILTTGIQPADGDLHYYGLNNEACYLYYRLHAYNGCYDPTNYTPRCSELQFYGYQMKALIPTMTSNTTPSGEVSASSYSSNYEPYKAFLDNGWAAKVDGDSYLQYKFDNPENVKVIMLKALGDRNFKISSFQGSNDGVNFVDLPVDVTDISQTNVYYTIAVDNSKSYKIYRLNCTQESIFPAGISNLQFYKAPKANVADGEDNEGYFETNIEIGSLSYISEVTAAQNKTVSFTIATEGAYIVSITDARDEQQTILINDVTVDPIIKSKESTSSKGLISLGYLKVNDVVKLTPHGGGGASFYLHRLDGSNNTRIKINSMSCVGSASPSQNKTASFTIANDDAYILTTSDSRDGYQTVSINDVTLNPFIKSKDANLGIISLGYLKANDVVKVTPSGGGTTDFNLHRVGGIAEGTKGGADFQMMYVMSGYQNGSPGFYKETIIERATSGIVPYNVNVYNTSTNVNPAGIFDNDYWQGTKVDMYNAVITLKKDCLYRANDTAEWQEMKAGATITWSVIYTNHVGASMIFK